MISVTVVELCHCERGSRIKCVKDWAWLCFLYTHGDSEPGSACRLSAYSSPSPDLPHYFLLHVFYKVDVSFESGVDSGEMFCGENTSWGVGFTSHPIRRCMLSVCGPALLVILRILSGYNPSTVSIMFVAQII